jgi:imidazolonepropionase
VDEGDGGDGSDERNLDRVWVGADLATMDEAGGIGHVPDAVLAIRDGRIAWLGTRQQLQAISWSAAVETDARGLWITPGLIECHTAPRVCRRPQQRIRCAIARCNLRGHCARAGGGIVSTMRATRTASEDDLLAQSLPRAQALVSEGVTTLEVKSGYGLDLASELKMLRVARRLGEQLGIDVIKTFLGAHALPPEFAHRQDHYIDHVCEDMLPAVAAEQLADAADAFLRTDRLHARADRTRIRARQQARPEVASACRSVERRRRRRARSRYARALGGSSRTCIRGLAAAHGWQGRDRGSIARRVLLLARETDCRRSTRCARSACRWRSRRLQPGTSPIASLLLAMNMACVLFRMTAAEVLRGVTVNAARALGLGEDRGMLRAGMRADLAIWKLRHPEQLCAESRHASSGRGHQNDTVTFSVAMSTLASSSTLSSPASNTRPYSSRCCRSRPG